MLLYLSFLFWTYSSLSRKLKALVVAIGALESRRKTKSKAVSGIMLTLLLASMLTLTFNVQPTRPEPATWYVYGSVTIESNSTISNFETFPGEYKISFVVEGTAGTTGFCNVTIPFKLLGGPYLFWIDGVIDFFHKQETTNDTHVFIYLTYTLSTHTVWITGTTWGSPTLAPVATFSVSDATPSVGDKVTFDASDSYDPNGTIESWNWNLGDGTTDTGEIVNYTYTTAGNFTVTLTVIDDEGLTGTAKTDMIVLSAVRDVAVTNITVLPTKVKIGEPVSISVTITNQGDSRETFEVTVYYDNTKIKTESITDLVPGNSKTLNISWETPPDIDPDTYTIRAVAETVPNETKIDNNTANDTVTIAKDETLGIPLNSLIVATVIAIVLIAAAVVYFTKVRKKA